MGESLHRHGAAAVPRTVWTGTYVPPSLVGRFVQLTSAYITDRRLFVLSLAIPVSLVSSGRPWRLDVRAVQDAKTRDGLARALRLSMVGAVSGHWDRLKEQWRHYCAASGHATRARVSNELRLVTAKVCITKSTPSPSSLIYV